MTVLEYCIENGIELPSPCGGNGTCGKCLVSIDGGPPVAACRVEYKLGQTIVPLASQGTPLVPERSLGDEDKMDAQDAHDNKNDSYGVALDIGTTTIACAIKDLISGDIVARRTRANSGRVFGADVISRINAGNNGKASEMTSMLRNDVQGVINEALREVGGVTPHEIFVSGNVTMIYTLMGYDTHSLGVYPYKLNKSGVIIDETGKVYPGCRTVIFPEISAFVGGDIVAGLYYIRKNETDDIYALMDLGTNGEMVVVKGDVIYVSSAAAGPVFEGAGISCGSPSVAGAIDHVRLKEGSEPVFDISMLGFDSPGAHSYETAVSSCTGSIHNSSFGMGHPSPEGICGSGVLDCAYEIYRGGLCDSTGAFRDPEGYLISKEGDVSFTQKDMRSFQLAKGAVRAGFDILLERAGLGPEDLSALYIAGGMGFSIRPESAAGTGLIDPRLRDRVKTVGNSSLKGAVAALMDEEEVFIQTVEKTVSSAVTVDTALAEGFQDRYMKAMDFPPL